MIFNKIKDIIDENNPEKTIVLKDYFIDIEDLYCSNDNDSINAREELNNLKYDIVLDAVDIYNNNIEDNDKIKYWEGDDESIDLIDELYDYVNEKFEIVIN